MATTASPAMAVAAAGERPFYIVDAFTSQRHRGNSAAVVLMTAEVGGGSDPTDAELQSVAAEFNLSETAFVWLPAALEAAAPLRLRWFTPECEVPLCGHATLATAAAVFRHCGSCEGAARLVFDTLCGLLPVARDRDSGQWCLDFPLATVESIAVGERDASQSLLAAVLGLELADPSADAVAAVAHSPDRAKLLVELRPARRRELHELRPDFAAMLTAAPSGRHIRGVIVTVAGDSDGGEADVGTGDRFDFLSRYFAPWVGIPEDPVTGSAHTVLAAYWRRRLDGRDRMLARQCSRRGGVLGIRVDADRGRVALSGDAVVSARGWVAV